jgi:hypothetical protein
MTKVSKPRELKAMSTWSTQLPPIPYTEIKIQDLWTDPSNTLNIRKAQRLTYPKHLKQTNKRDSKEYQDKHIQQRYHTQIYAFQ